MNQVTLNTLGMCEAALKHAYEVLDHTQYLELAQELEAAMLTAGLTIDEIAATPNYISAYQVWQEKTEWVQETAKPKELGMHRADVLRKRIEDLEAELVKESARTASEKLRADQMTQQHKMQADMRKQLEAELLKLKEQK